MTSFFSKKPTSPHLTIYLSQKSSSLISILHRFSGIFLLTLFIFFNIFLFLSIQIYYYFSLNYFYYLLSLYLIKFLSLFSIFHILNGLRFTLIKFNFIKI